MKRLILLAIFIVSCGFAAFAQDEEVPKNEGDNGLLKTGGDRITASIYSDMWQMDSDTNITIKSVNPGFNFNYFFNVPVAGKFSMGIGLGISTHSMNSDAMPYEDTLSKTAFQKIPKTVNGKDIDYDINKLALTYLDIPLELRFTTTTPKDKKVKLALGIKGGYMINNHIKYKGTDLSDGEGDSKFKQFNIANLEPIRYGAIFRIGYANYHLFGYYSLSKLFKKDKGPEMFPISVGIGVSM